MAGFVHDIAGGNGDLVITSVQSPNFDSGISGWQIAKDGSGQFNDLEIRGTFNGNDFIINSSGAFYYAGTPAAGNLSTSSVPGTTGGTDASGNHYLPGTTAYGAASATQLADGFITFYAGSQAAGWTAKSTLQFTGVGIVLLSGGLETGSNVLDDGSGGANIAGSMIVQGDVAAAGTACTLSGGASATIPATAPSRTALGSTWNATTASQCNQNFVNIINALGSVGIFL